MYPHPQDGDAIKATYLIHIYPFVEILVGHLLEYIHYKRRILSNLILGGLTLVANHNLPAMVNSYPLFPF